jgi:exodeoxyribonuclease V gamma subunit
MWAKVTSNRVERLVEALVEHLQLPPKDPMEPEWIVVQSLGMKRFLEMEMAKALGVCANVRFLLPQRFINEVIVCALQEGESLGDFESESLSFASLKAIEGVLHEEPFSAVRAYLASEEPEGGERTIGRKELLFAINLGDIYGRYLAYRPLMIVGWDEGHDSDDWQAILWRAIRAHLKALHPAALGLRFKEKGGGRRKSDSALPSRIHIFGISSLPPFYLDILGRLSDYTDLYLFVFSPSCEYLGDFPRTTKHLTSEGHPLLASFGRLSMDFQELLTIAESERPFADDKELFVDTASIAKTDGRTPTMLEFLQSDMLAFRMPSPKHEIELNDYSIRVHACHTNMRQVEVLRDELLHLLDSDYSLQPHEIVVMCPDIEAFTPIISAVFGGDAGKDTTLPQIPYSIADRAPSKENSVATLVTVLMELANGRLKASEVVDFLAIEVVRQRFGIAPDDLARMRSFIRDATIRWGLDEEHKKNLLGVESDECTWRFGLDRLLLGLALPEGTMFGDVVASDAGGSVASETLQKFVEVIVTLFRTLKRLRAPRRFPDWVAQVSQIIEDFVPLHLMEFEQEAQEVYSALKDAQARADDVKLERLWEPKAFLAFLETCVSTRGGSGGLLRKGITFCRMVPLRNIPFKVVALLGMDDGAFPRKGIEVNFDKIAQEKKRGDRNPRDDDLQMFLEAILSARQHLVITYTCFDPKTKKELPPASPVAQLVEILEHSFMVKGENGEKDAVKELVLVHHPLHPFSPNNFLPEKPWSYDTRYLEAARMMLRESSERKSPFTEPIQLKEPPKSLFLRELEEFLAHPQRFFLRYHGFVPSLEDCALEDEELVTLSNLEQYMLKEALLEDFIRRKADEETLARLQRQGAMPVGRMALACFQTLQEDTEELQEEIGRYLSVEHSRFVQDVSLDGVRIRGDLELWGRDYVFWTVGNIDTKRLIRVWVRHLWLLCACDGYSGNAILYGFDKKGGFVKKQFKKPDETASDLLGTLVRLYSKGLQFPLPLFLESSHEFCKSAQDDQFTVKTPGSWHDRYERGACERLDPFVLLAFGDHENPQDIPVPRGFPDFVEVSREVFSPLLSSLKDVTRGEEDE